MNKEEIYLNLAEYVGANSELKSYSIDFLKREYSDWYDLLYRIWQQYDYIDYLKNDNNIIINKQKYYSMTASLDTIIELSMDINLNKKIITQHSGYGINPIIILKYALNNNFITKEKIFVNNVIKQFDYQKEVLFLDDINVINNTNIYGYLYNNKILKIS